MSLRAIAGKELRDVLREKSLLTAFLIQLFLAGFSALLLAGLTALHSPDALDAAPDVTIAYTGPGGMLPYLEDRGNIVIVELPDDEALTAFREGSITGIIEETYAEEDTQRRVTIILAEGELQSTLIITQLKDMLIDYETDLREERSGRLSSDFVPERSGIRPSEPYSFVYTTLIPLLVVTPVFLSGAIAGDALSQESKSRTLLIMRSTPISTARLVVGKLLVPVVLVPLQVGVWLGLFWLNGFPTTDPWLVIGFATILGIFVTGTGSIIAAVVRDESTTQAAYAVFVLTVGVFSMLLPRDPLNIIALLATGVQDALVWRSVVWVAVASVAGLAVSIWLTGRSIRRDML